MAASVNPASGKRRPLIEFDLAENIRSAIASEPTSADSEWAGGNAMIRDAPIALDNLVEFDEDAAAMLEVRSTRHTTGNKKLFFFLLWFLVFLVTGSQRKKKKK
jgi:hypothetical protein